MEQKQIYTFQKKKARATIIRYRGESFPHFRHKLRIAKIFYSKGWHPTVERRMPCSLDCLTRTIQLRYRADVFAWKGTRRIIAEIDGFRGHKSRQAHHSDLLRTVRIRERYGKEIEVYRFSLKRLNKWSDKEIAEEMKLS